MNKEQKILFENIYYKKLLKHKPKAEDNYRNAYSAHKKSQYKHYKILKNITEELLKIEIIQSKRRAKNARISQKH